MSLATIGQKLRSAREAQGLTLAQVYERTKIPLNHLQAVEVGDSDELPEPVFVFGFIKRYAECVGLDGQVIADEYRRHVEEVSGNNRKNHNTGTPYYASSEYMNKSRIRVSTPTYKMWLFNAIMIVGVIGLITFVINTQQNNIINQPDPSLKGLQNATRGLAPVAPLPNQAAQNQTQGAPPVPDSTQRLTLSANRHVWVEVKRLSNGDSIFTGYLEQGDRRDFDDPQGLIVRAGDGGSLSVERLGKVEPFGLNGKVSERQFGSAQPGGTEAAGTTTGTAAVSTPGSAAVRPVIKRVRKVISATETPRPRRVEPRRYESSSAREAPARYSEGRLDSD
jgi:cytoskeleton protein RodZ